MERKWLLKQNKVDTKAMAGSLGVSESVAQVLANRKIGTYEGAWNFLQAPLSAIRDPRGMKDFSKGLSRICTGVREGLPITVYGDYDVDGVTSTVILTKAIRDIGGQVNTYTPSRHEEGYGLNLAAVQALADAGCKLIVTCDNGIASVAEVAFAQSLGMQVVILDHHEAPETGVPLAEACIDPKQPDCPYPFKLLCAGGLSYLFAMALYEEMGIPCPRQKELLAFAALATVCDMVDLLEENRILAKNGLAVMGQTGNAGLGALLKQTGLWGKPFTEYHAGFVIGPCINAAGRLETAKAALSLFFTEDPAEAACLAEELAALNEERKQQTAEATKRVMETLSAAEQPRVIVHYDAEIAEGIIGIVAGRVKEAYCRPVILLTAAQDGGAKGSGRSIEAYHLFEALFAQRALMTRFGGHAMAAGLSIPTDAVSVLRKNLNDTCTFTEADMVPVARLEGVLRGQEATLALAKELAVLAPFGKGNPAPVFGMKALRLERTSYFGKEGQFLRLILRTADGGHVTATSFSHKDAFLDDIKCLKNATLYEKIRKGENLDAPVFLDLLVRLEVNVYMGRETLQVRLVDFRLSK